MKVLLTLIAGSPGRKGRQCIGSDSDACVIITTDRFIDVQRSNFEIDLQNSVLVRLLSKKTSEEQEKEIKYLIAKKCVYFDHQ